MTGILRERPPILRGILRKSVVTTCIGYVGLNFGGWLKSRLNLSMGGGSTHKAMNTEQSLAYIHRVFDEYRNELNGGHFFGRVAEIGPGDNAGVALLVLADGAESIDLADRFYSGRDAAQQSAVYRALIAVHPELRRRFGDSDKEEQFRGIVRHYGEGAAAERFFQDHGPYDFIVSRAVLEHLPDPRAAIAAMAAALNPGGHFLHVVDLRDHGMFSLHGHHEMKFYEIPSWLYSAMTRASGLPNRVPLSRYRAALDATDLVCEIKVTSLVGQRHLACPMAYEEIASGLRGAAIAKIRAHRQSFARELAGERDEDLSISGFYIVGRKP